MPDLAWPRALNSPTFSEISDVLRNLLRSPKSPAFSEISDVLQNLRRSPIISDVPHPRPSAAMSQPGKEQGARERPRGKGVDRRPSAEVVAEMEVLARQDRAKIGAPIPPAPRPPGRFFVTRRPPLPRQPPCINPYVPPSPDRARIARAAAISAREHEASEAYLLAEADAAPPREPSPPRADDNYFDLARWARRRWV